MKDLFPKILLLFVVGAIIQLNSAFASTTISGVHATMLVHINFSRVSMAVGWIGTVLYILAYLLLCLGKLTASSKSYHLLNILGAIGLIINAADMHDYPSFVVNLIWMIIAAITLLLLIKKKKQAT